jgi:SAM-dependent methyltransferase
LAGSGFVVDYDGTAIPATYDRGHDHGAAVLDLWMRHIASYVDESKVHSVLDLACGTGRFAPSLAGRFNATVIGLDPSMKMLRLAQQKCGHDVPLVAGAGETLPLRSSTIDVIFMSMVFHHFTAPADMARECARVLRRPGRVFVRTITADQIPNYPYVRFFPGTRPLLERRLPTQRATRAVFEAAGFTTVAADVVVQEIARDYAEYADKLAAGADTTINSLPRREVDEGLSRMRATPASRAIVEPIDLLVFAPAGNAA